MNHDQTISEENDHHIRELQQKINILFELEKEILIMLLYDDGKSSQVVCEI